LHQGRIDATGPSTNEELYNGKEVTDAHGLNGYHEGARFYDVEIARWTTMDPADEFHSPYVYVGGDPVNLVDPDGRASEAPQDVYKIDSDGNATWHGKRVRTKTTSRVLTVSTENLIFRIVPTRRVL
jgi:RHS repeat-associated protein